MKKNESNYIKPGTLIRHNHQENGLRKYQRYISKVAKILEVTSQNIIYKTYISKEIYCVSRLKRLKLITKKERHKIADEILNLFYDDCRFLSTKNKLIETKQHERGGIIRVIKVKEVDFIRRKIIGKPKFRYTEDWYQRSKSWTVDVSFDDFVIPYSFNTLKKIMYKKFEEDIEKILEEEKRLKLERAKRAKNGLTVVTANDYGGELSIADGEGRMSIIEE